MQITDENYRALLAAGADKQVRAVVGGVTYDVAQIVSAKTAQSLGNTSLPVGNCVAAQLDLALWHAGSVPRMAEIKLYVRLDDGANQSSWLQKGTYYVDTREYDAEDDVLTLHAYDAMLKTEQPYTQPGNQGAWPRRDTAVVTDIAQRIGVTIDARTTSILDKGYQVQYPGIRLEDGAPKYSADGAFSMREVLGYIGVMYGGNWIISDAGALRLVPLRGEVSGLRVDVSTLNTSPALDPVSRVTVVLGTDSDGTEVAYTSGTDTGRELRAVCPWGTQAIADDLIDTLGGYVYQPFEATDALLDPAAELGDEVSVGNVASIIMSASTLYDALYTSDIGAPQDEEIDHEYPYEARQNREIKQSLAATSAQLRVDVDSIESEVSGKIDEQEAKTLISQGINGITLAASAGSNQSTVSIEADGITVDSAVVRFSNIVANSVSADGITTGTINAANQTLNLKGSLKIYTPDGTLVGEVGGHEDAVLRAAWLTDRTNRATFIAVESSSGTKGTAIIGGDEIQLRMGPIRLDGSAHYGTSAPNSSTPGYGLEGALYFKI